MTKFLLLFLFPLSCLSGQVVKSSSASTSPWSGNYLQYVFQPVKISITNTNSASADFSWALIGAAGQDYMTIPSGSTRVFNVTPLSVSVHPYFIQFSSPVSWTGLSFSSPVTGNFSTKNYSVSYTSRINGVAAGSGVLPVTCSAGTSSISFVSGDQSTTLWLLEPVEVTANIGDVNLAVTPRVVPKVYGSGVIFIDNTLGEGQVVPFGTENIFLKPGHNAFPFNGELDAYGNPKAAPAGMLFTRVESASGQVGWIARLAKTPTGTTWGSSSPSPASYFDGGGATPPVIKLPNFFNGALTDYVSLPAKFGGGGTSFNIKPGGLTIGGDGLPVGVTPGSTGALPAGVLSGGSTYLPAGVSAGTYSGSTTSSRVGDGLNPGGGGGVAPMTGDGTSAVSQLSTSPDPIPLIPSMSGMEEEGLEKGRVQATKIINKAKAGVLVVDDKARTITGVANKAGYLSTQLQAPSPALFGGSDMSWMSFTVPIARWSAAITIPSQWLLMMREILLWGVKIWFVTAVLKLLMR